MSDLDYKTTMNQRHANIYSMPALAENSPFYWRPKTIKNLILLILTGVYAILF